jgi:hypothetical protein
VGVLRAIKSEDPSWRHRLTVDSFNDAKFIGPNFDQWDLSNDAFKRILD